VNEQQIIAEMERLTLHKKLYNYGQINGGGRPPTRGSYRDFLRGKQPITWGKLGFLNQENFFRSVVG